jgi:rhodanese-related sulfurtransferase
MCGAVMAAPAGHAGYRIAQAELAQEYRAGHLPGAVSVPLDDLGDRLAGLPVEAAA